MSKKVEHHAKADVPDQAATRKLTIRVLDKVETTGLCSPNG